MHGESTNAVERATWSESTILGERAIDGERTSRIERTQ